MQMRVPLQRAALLLPLILILGTARGQRVAPGVNPQHYQQVPQQVPQHHPPPPPQHQQQYQQQVHSAPGVPPVQYQYEPVPVQQQQPVQYQQVPVQQQQQQQQPPVHQPQQQQVHHQQQQQQVHQQAHAGGHHHGQPQQVLNTGNIQQERAHIQEHMQVPIDTSKMSEAELQFHYFKMHDSDNNNKLDGCELIKSLIHWHVKEAPGNPEDVHADHGEEHKSGSVYTDKALEDTIDYVLKSMDLNNDGFVDWAEYRKTEANVGKD
ncbi:lymphotoxin beta receptor inhibitor isoform X2 [Drosophila bipectinata]|uniref:lymphotoxin beta receptor inhibitor isoform X2 n=1 Tax=Drosophila bipectinata TaxID=42026 RepID=UPI001C89101F|nr:G-box-binding factor isoform X2 [Drosophila bipectinata]